MRGARDWSAGIILFLRVFRRSSPSLSVDRTRLFPRRVIHLARGRPDIFSRGLRLKKAGNHLMEVVGGRSVHPVNVRVGGFCRAPSASDLRGLIPELEQARQDGWRRWNGWLRSA